MKKKLTLASLLLVGALVGCGGGNAGNSTPSEESSQDNQSSVVETTSSEEGSSEVSEETSEATSPYGTLEAPLSVSAINDLVDQLQASDWNNKYFSENIAYATGFAKSVSYNSKYNSYTVVITDGTEEFTIYSGEPVSEDVVPVPGDTVVASGYYINFNGTYEFSGNNDVYPSIHSSTHNTVNITSKVVDGEGADSTNGVVSGLASTAESGSTVSFTVSVSDGYKVNEVTVGGKAIVDTDGTYSFVVGYNNEIIVEVVDASVVDKVVELTSATLLNYSGSNVAYANNVEHVVEGVTFETTQVAAYADSGGVLQFRKPGNSNGTGVFFNKTAFASGVASIDFTFSTVKNTKDITNAFKIELAADSTFTTVGETLYVSYTNGTAAASVTPTSNTYTYCRITVNSGTGYLDAVNINLA